MATLPLGADKPKAEDISVPKTDVRLTVHRGFGSPLRRRGEAGDDDLQRRTPREREGFQIVHLPKVWADGGFRGIRSQCRSKGHTCGKATLLAVRAGQELIDVWHPGLRFLSFEPRLYLCS